MLISISRCISYSNLWSFRVLMRSLTKHFADEMAQAPVKILFLWFRLGLVKFRWFDFFGYNWHFCLQIVCQKLMVSHFHYMSSTQMILPVQIWHVTCWILNNILLTACQVFINNLLMKVSSYYLQIICFLDLVLPVAY